MSRMKVLVTGGAGFIGSNLVDKLLDNNYDVKVLDNLIYGNLKWVSKEAEFLNGDIRDIELCKKAVKSVDAVFHLAAMSRSGPSFQNITDCTEINILGTQNMLLAARDAGVSKFVYSGSSTFYGNSSAPQNEVNTPPDFLNAYGLSKFVGEEYVSLFDKIYGLPTISFRYFNVYGPRQPVDGAYALVLGIFLNNKKMLKPLIIHGDGSQRRDFVHVSDVANANILALESLHRNRIYNVGSGVNYSIIEIAKMISDNIIYVPRRLGDADITLADISSISADLGWVPSMSFSNGLMDLKKYYGL
jgi:nucleoside-diphosphate-sugar epimerase